MDDKKNKLNLFKRIFRSRKRTIIIILIVVIGIVVWRYYVARNNKEIKTTVIRKGNVQEELILSGEVSALEYANLTFQSSGELDYIGVKEGDNVKKSQVLARLDTTVLNQAYLSAESDLRRYQTSLDKTYDDVQGHQKDESFAQRETRTISETNKDKAYRAYIAAQQNLTNASMKAPFDGIIASVTYPFTGVNTVFSQPQIEILNPDTIYFDASADQSEVIEIKLGQKVAIILDAYSSKEYEGAVTYIGFTPRQAEVGTSYKVKIDFNSLNYEDEKLKIGMGGDAKIILSEKSDVLYLPSEFVKSDSKGKYINYGKKNNKRYIETGLEGEDRVEVKGEIKEGDVVYD